MQLLTIIDNFHCPLITIFTQDQICFDDLFSYSFYLFSLADIFFNSYTGIAKVPIFNFFTKNT